MMSLHRIIQGASGDPVSEIKLGFPTARDTDHPASMGSPGTGDHDDSQSINSTMDVGLPQLRRECTTLACRVGLRLARLGWPRCGKLTVPCGRCTLWSVCTLMHMFCMHLRLQPGCLGRATSLCLSAGLTLQSLSWITVRLSLHVRLNEVVDTSRVHLGCPGMGSACLGAYSHDRHPCAWPS